MEGRGNTIAGRRGSGIGLRDSARLQEEDAGFANEVGYSKHRPALPLYDSSDVEKTLPLMRTTAFDDPVEVAEGMVATLRPAGHILGSSTVGLEADGGSVLFSGDLGRTGPRCCGRRPTRRRATSWSSSRRTATAGTRPGTPTCWRPRSGGRSGAAAAC